MLVIHQTLLTTRTQLYVKLKNNKIAFCWKNTDCRHIFNGSEFKYTFD